MPGPHIFINIRSALYSLSVPGLAGLWIACWVQLAAFLPEEISSVSLAAGAAVTGVLFIVLSASVEAAVRFGSGKSRLIGSSRVSASGVTGLIKFAENASSRRYAFLSVSLTIVLGLGLLTASAQFRDPATLLSGVVFVFLLMSGGGLLIRGCPIQGFPGGDLANRYLPLLAEDEESAATVARVISVLSSGVIALTGLLILASPGKWGTWGLAVFIAGIDGVLLTQWHARRSRWMTSASQRGLDSIVHSRLPTISQTAPISELFSIFAIEGNRATVVVLDASGKPEGVIHLRQLRTAAQAARSSEPREVMVSLSDLPRLPASTSVLNAALFLERHRLPALVAEGTDGGVRVLSLDELRRIVD
jgi:CBS domain-containing protein